jgi:hypothetical protein
MPADCVAALTEREPQFSTFIKNSFDADTTCSSPLNGERLSKCSLIASRSQRAQAPSLSGCPGIDHDLGHILFLVAPDFVHFRSLVERDAVRNNVAGTDLTFFDALEAFGESVNGDDA